MTIKRSIFICSIAFFSLLLSFQPVRAQMCDTLFELITTLRPSVFGFPSVWDAKYGMRDSMVQMASGVTMEDGTVFTYGRSLSKKDFRPQDILLAKINRRGRALMEEKYPAKTAEEPIKMIRRGKMFVALSNIRGGAGNAEKWARLSWYDLDGKYKKERILKDATFDYDAMTLVAAAEKKDGFVAVLRAVNRKDESDQNGVLMRFSAGGELLWRRVYRPGIPNVVNNLRPVATAHGNAYYIASGRIRLDDGRMAGWAMKLGYDGAVHWQRTYPRGEFSVFRDAVLSASESTEGHGFILSGDSKPTDGGPVAAWVMSIDALGEPQWQRYYRRPDYELSGNWITKEQDGRLVLIMNAKAVDGEGGHNHIRLLTLSPRGIQIQDEGYFEGREAVASDYVPGWNGERVLTATIESDSGTQEKEAPPIVVVGLAAEDRTEAEEEEAKKPQKPVFQGWVLVVNALDPYADPCKAQ